MLNNRRQLQPSSGQLDHNRLRTLINSMSDGFLALDTKGEIELSNSVALDLLDTNSLEAKNIADAMPVIDSTSTSHNLLELLEAGASNMVSRDYRLKYKDGKVINLYINLSLVRAPFGNASKGGYVVLFRDITEEKNAADERDEFISVASHELRNPVAIAEGSLSNAILLAERAKAADNVQHLLKSAHDQVIFLSNLINDLAMVSRADRDKFVKSAEEFDATEVMKALQTDYTAQAQKKGLEIKTQLDECAKVYGSQLYTREILQNFVTNAIKYTATGWIMLKATNSGDGVDLTVSDSGFGIGPDEQKKLFSKFFRSDDSRVRKINGTGLGLYVSAKLAKLMGGSLTMTSELNKGSSFVLHLPYASTKPPATPAPKPVA